jgi:hypothetical protein
MFPLSKVKNEELRIKIEKLKIKNEELLDTPASFLAGQALRRGKQIIA